MKSAKEDERHFQSHAWQVASGPSSSEGVTEELRVDSSSLCTTTEPSLSKRQREPRVRMDEARGSPAK